jgi:predicted ribosome quality control (RQC) complex YloA/Tae2 family protein
MLGLPKTTEFNKRIPKQKFYDNLTVSPALKRSFVDQIRIIYWANKIAPSTVNLAAGKTVTEIEVFLVRLNEEKLDENVLKQIDREIPYHILFVLEHEGVYKAVIGYKEAAGSGKAAFKVDRYYQTEWIPEDELPVHLDGLDIDAVYENFVRQIAGDALQAAAPQESLKESVERDDRREELKKEIAKMQSKIRKEKQLNRQMEMNAELKKLKGELEELL